VPSSPTISRRNGDHPGTGHEVAVGVTVSELLVFVASHEIDPDAEIVVRLNSGSQSMQSGCVNVAFIRLTNDGHLQLDIHEQTSRTTRTPRRNLNL
jgi:hypothetical protein